MCGCGICNEKVREEEKVRTTPSVGNEDFNDEVCEVSLRKNRLSHLTVSWKAEK